MRRLALEQLESRHLCYAPCVVKCDVNNDGSVTSQDALQVVNAVNSGNSSLVNDVNASGAVTPIDALILINWLNIKPATIYRVKVTDADTVGFTDQQVRDAIFAAFDEYEAIADVGFDFVTSGQHLTINTYEIYLGNGVHARGYQIGSTVSLHNGIIAPYHHSGQNGPINQTLYYKIHASVGAIRQVTGHEIGHWIGLDVIFGSSGHSADPVCRMNINAPPGFCAAEVTWLVNRFGASKSPNG